LCGEGVAVDHYTGQGEAVEEALVEEGFFGGDGEVFKGEVPEAVVFRSFDVGEDFTGELNIPEGDMVGDRRGRGGAALEVEELGPGFGVDQAVGGAGDPLDGDVFVKLGGIGAHLKPEYPGRAVYLAVLHQDVPVVDGFASAGDRRVAEAEGAVADQNVHIRAVGGVGIGVRAFTPLEGDGIVVDLHVAAVDQDMGAGVEVDGVGAGGLDGFHGREDVQVDELCVVAFIEVGGPEARILEAYIADDD